ncbi:MAG: hypothetical protein RIF33_22005 [Cyclobacteriaceae bacterium]
MKELCLTLLLISCLLLEEAHAFKLPTDSTNNTEVFGIYLEAGYRSNKVANGELAFGYIDESPSRDNLFTDVDLGSNNSYDLVFGIITMSNRTSVDFSARGTIGQLNGWAVDLGYGYNLYQKRDFFIRTMGSISYGALGVKIGSIENNDLFIQVNDKQFYNERVGVRARSNYLSFRPSLDFGFPGNRSIIFKAGYNFVLTTGTILRFSGSDVNEGSLRALESLDADNVSFIIDGVSSSEIPVEYNGLYFGLAVVF